MRNMQKEFIKSLLPPEFLTLKRLANEHFQSIKRRKSGTYSFQKLASQTNIKLEFGSGSKKGKLGWTTVDICPGADIEWDLLNDIPLPDNSVDAIYSSHLLEHLSYKELIRTLSDWFRLLKPQGKILICVPDATHYLEAFFDPSKLEKFIPSFYAPAFNYHSPLDYVNYIAYMDGNHKHLFDQANLHAILKAVGYVHVKDREFDPSLDRMGHHWESIYAEAMKP